MLEEKTNGEGRPFLLKDVSDAPNRQAETLLGQAICKGENSRLGAADRRRGAVAQMGERCNRTAEVRGSIPLSSTSPFDMKNKHNF